MWQQLTQLCYHNFQSMVEEESSELYDKLDFNHQTVLLKIGRDKLCPLFDFHIFKT